MKCILPRLGAARTVGRLIIFRLALPISAGVSDCMSNSNLEVARGLQLQPQFIRVEAPSPEYQEAFAAMERERAQALVVLGEPINQACRKQIAELAVGRHLPTVFSDIDARCGRPRCLWHESSGGGSAHASYADKILRGANPGDLSIKAALSHELVLNLQTAQARNKLSTRNAWKGQPSYPVNLRLCKAV